jgi:hypothetical protein
MDWKVRKKITNPPTNLETLARLVRANEDNSSIEGFVIGKAIINNGLKKGRCYCFRDCQKPLTEGPAVVMTVKNTKGPSPSSAYIYLFHQECYANLIAT